MQRFRWLGVAVATMACGNTVVVIEGGGGSDATGGAGPTTSVTTSSTPTAVCGNGIVEPGEFCDDGNGIVTDACLDQPAHGCVAAGCGDGVVWTGVEQCDDGNGDDEDGCTTLCVLEIACGNGVVEPGESCDDGNASLNDACPSGPDAPCQPAACGDGFVHEGVEHCDDGNAVPFDGCNPSCACSAATSAPAWTFTGGWGLYTEAPPSQQVPMPIPFPTAAIGTDGNRVPPYPGSESEDSFAQTPVITLPAQLTFESWNVDEGGGPIDTKRIKISVNGQTYITLADCDQAPSYPFCQFTGDKAGTEWTPISVSTAGFAGQKGVVRIEYSTGDACCGFERGWFIRNANFFPCP